MKKRTPTAADLKFPFVSQTAERAEYQRKLDAMEHARQSRWDEKEETPTQPEPKPRKVRTRRTLRSRLLGHRATHVYASLICLWMLFTVIVPTEWQKVVYGAVGDAGRWTGKQIVYWWEDRDLPYGTTMTRYDYDSLRSAETAGAASTASPSAVPTVAPTIVPTASPSATPTVKPTVSGNGGVAYIRANWQRCNEVYSRVEHYAVMYKVPIDIFLAVGSAESGCRAEATNDNGANGKDRGFCQLNNLYHLPNDADAYDLEKNLNYCGILLSQVWKKHGNWNDALGHFHRGPSNFNDWRGESYAEGVLKRAGRI